MNGKKRAEELRSHRWYGVRDLRSFGHRSRTKQMGYAEEEYRGKPLIAIINTWSDINPCHSHFRDRAEEVKRLKKQQAESVVEHDVKVTLLAERWDPRDAGLMW